MGGNEAGLRAPAVSLRSAPDPAAGARPWHQELAKKQGFPGRAEGGGNEAKRGLQPAGVAEQGGRGRVGAVTNKSVALHRDRLDTFPRR